MRLGRGLGLEWPGLQFCLPLEFCPSGSLRDLGGGLMHSFIHSFNIYSLRTCTPDTGDTVRNGTALVPVPSTDLG